MDMAKITTIAAHLVPTAAIFIFVFVVVSIL